MHIKFFLILQHTYKSVAINQLRINKIKVINELNELLFHIFEMLHFLFGNN